MIHVFASNDSHVDMSTSYPDPWPAILVSSSLNATVSIPGSKSLSNRYLILAALSDKPVVLRGLLRSRDTDLMLQALQVFGVRWEVLNDDGTTIRVVPSSGRILHVASDACVECGLAGTVMRFVAALALFADKPVRFDGDQQAYARPMLPVLDGLEQLGARIIYHGNVGSLPFTIVPPDCCALLENKRVKSVSIDASASSQFISALLLIGSRIPGGLLLTHTGSSLPSMPHIRMTMSDVAAAGGVVQMDRLGCWNVQEHELSLPDCVTVEPDLSNAAPFLGAALIAGGRVRVPYWPLHTMQPGSLLPEILRKMGAVVSFEQDERDHSSCVVSVEGDGIIHAVPSLDLSEAGEIAPSIAAILAFADGMSQIHGIAHLRGHETNRLAALVTELQRVGIGAQELEDGIRIIPSSHTRAAIMESYADHRMATFGAMLGLRIPQLAIRNIATTRKTIPDFPAMWSAMIASE